MELGGIRNKVVARWTAGQQITGQPVGATCWPAVQRATAVLRMPPIWQSGCNCLMHVLKDISEERQTDNILNTNMREKSIRNMARYS